MIAPGFKRLVIGPDRKLRMLWRAVIFFALAYWVLPVALDPAFDFVAQRLHLAAGFTAAKNKNGFCWLTAGGTGGVLCLAASDGTNWKQIAIGANAI